MKIEIDPTEVHLGNWIAPAALEPLIEPMAVRWHKRLSGCFCGDWEDLAQAGRIALWQYLQAKGEVERVRELEALAVLDRAFFAEVRATRTGLWGRKRVEVDWDRLEQPQPVQPNEDQRYLLDLFLMNAAKAARRPNWEMLWLVRVQQWEPQWVTDYFKRKRDDRHCYPPSVVVQRVELAEKRIRRQLRADLLEELTRYSWVSEWQ